MGGVFMRRKQLYDRYNCLVEQWIEKIDRNWVYILSNIRGKLKMKSNKENVAEEKDKGRSYYSELPEMEDTSPSKVAKKESHREKKENREIRILRKNKTLKERNDPDRFSGDGINFKAKIIGIERVLDARGNRMCQGALQRLKAAVKLSGDHKRKIILNISLNGIMIKEEKTGELLHHHPIHKISFISQDTNDTRAFGYVFGSPQTGHEFFGIKTEKIASQVVLTLRDLFLTALELKKKEMEVHREDTVSQETNVVSNGGGTTCMENRERKPCRDILYSNVVLLPNESYSENGNENACETELPGDALLDMQFTMDSLEQGISQMDHSIASAAPGLSFSEEDVSESSCGSFPTSFPFKLEKLSSLYQETLSLSSRSSSTSDHNIYHPEHKLDDPKRNLSESDCNVRLKNCGSMSLSTASSQSNLDPTQPSVEDRYAVFQDIDALPSIFDHPEIIQTTAVAVKEEFELTPKLTKQEDLISNEIKTPVIFAELDPLGDHPYVDKKDFFQDLKKPPKKVLKDLLTDTVNHSVEKDASNVTQLNPFASEVPDEEAANPFNPFVMGSNYHDIPPPSSPPPPPPPRLPTLSPPPPPRPPSRSTPTQSKKKSPFLASAQSWFSFDHDSPAVSQPEVDGPAPPLPSPARKFPVDPNLLKISSASNSPILPRKVLGETSCKALSRHSVVDTPSCLKDSPPLPPKPGFWPNPHISVSSGSVLESSSEAHSSSSLAVSSSDDSHMNSSSDALFANNGECSDIADSSSIELSPDSIFRRKSDPFADEFFLSLPRKVANGADDFKPPA
ncbi:protein disabled [Trichonephila inaurata madagascariensis]|uniref:Protein disabled n=1 Tax=Trichonephila inaurata madagascariensis TaxID=2747483 RepID=A0A8X6MDC1_9ARAC|nr:protein disabled [Trichonephila inaurata madagascariensis]